jgi:putative transposase
MKKRFTEEQIIKTLKRAEAGEGYKELCRELGIANQTFYAWKAKFSGMEVSDAKKLRELEAENAK